MDQKLTSFYDPSGLPEVPIHRRVVTFTIIFIVQIITVSIITHFSEFEFEIIRTTRREPKKTKKIWIVIIQFIRCLFSIP